MAKRAWGFLKLPRGTTSSLKPDGGVIQVEVNDPTDTRDRDNIREHLKHIGLAFSEGDFDIPMFVHDTVGCPR